MSRVPRPSALTASRVLVFALLAASGLAACSGSSPTAQPAAATSAATASPAAPSAAPASVAPASVAPASAAPVAASVAASLPASSVPVAVDPCQLVTQSEASALAGTTFGAGKPETDSGGGKMCVYQSATGNVFMVIVGQAPDAATAQSEWAQEQAKAQDALKKSVPAGVTVNFKVSDVSGISGADKAGLASFSESIGNVSLVGSAVYLLKGAVFLSFSDLAIGHAAPAASAMEAQATTSLGRLP